MKRTVILVATILISLILIIPATYSWFISREQKPNEFNVANYGVKLVEVFHGWEQKEVQVSNTGEAAVLVRVTAIPILMNYDKSERLNTTIDGDEILDFVRPANFAANWYDGGDGWYYYRHALLPGENTTLFLEKVVLQPWFDFNANPEYDGANLDVDVIMSSEIITGTYKHEDIWDVSSNPALKTFLRNICDSYSA